MLERKGTIQNLGPQGSQDTAEKLEEMAAFRRKEAIANGRDLGGRKGSVVKKKLFFPPFLSPLSGEGPGDFAGTSLTGVELVIKRGFCWRVGEEGWENKYQTREKLGMNGLLMSWKDTPKNPGGKEEFLLDSDPGRGEKICEERKIFFALSSKKEGEGCTQGIERDFCFCWMILKRKKPGSPR